MMNFSQFIFILSNLSKYLQNVDIIKIHGHQNVDVIKLLDFDAKYCHIDLGIFMDMANGERIPSNTINYE